MSGVETARELRRIGCPIFIVGATGNALKEDQEEVSLTTEDKCCQCTHFDPFPLPSVHRSRCGSSFDETAEATTNARNAGAGAVAYIGSNAAQDRRLPATQSAGSVMLRATVS